MANYKGSQVKTKVGSLMYVFIKGEGRDTAMPGQEPRMQYMASLECAKDGVVHTHIKGLIYDEWERYKLAFGVKGLPGLNKNGHPMDGMHEVLVDDPSGGIDPQTEKVLKIPNGDVRITFKTNTTWKDGKPKVVKVYDGKANNITTPVQSASWGIGAGSTGVIHGTAMGNNAGGTHKVSLYLDAVQLAKLVKYEGSGIDADELDDAEDIDLEVPGEIDVSDTIEV